MKYKTILFCLCTVAQWNGQALPQDDRLPGGRSKPSWDGINETIKQASLEGLCEKSADR